MLDFKGANQLLWYYADLERKQCEHSEDPPEPGYGNITMTALGVPIPGMQNTTMYKPDLPPPDINHCLAWRRFAK